MIPTSPFSAWPFARREAGLAPDAPFVAIGDIHGRADLLGTLLALLGAQAGPDWPLVCLGDYVDRGERSAEVLAMLQAGCWPGPVICLKGNHEAMMLDFLEDPVRVGPFWLRHGGAQTLTSFGIDPPDIRPDCCPDALGAARDQLRAALPPGTEAWLHALPLSYRSGNVLAVHAGADPRAAPDRQEERTLLWGHPEFLRRARRDGVWVVHGHTILDTLCAEGGRIGLDTGAYASDRLSAALITREGCRFVTTRDQTAGPDTAPA